jgi:hypothetical protein
MADIGNTINTLENSLRDLIEIRLRALFGDKWFENLGVSEERIESWTSRMAEEPKRRPGGQPDDRPLYYSEFHDLIQIIHKNWSQGFKDCFGDKKRFEVYMDRLSAFRNPDAHSRALRPFEEHLVIGMAGELRQEITVFLSRGAGGTEREHFPRIEEVLDSFGNRVAPDTHILDTYDTGLVLRVGDVVTFSGRAWDPDGDELTWTVTSGGVRTLATIQGNEFELVWTTSVEDIAEMRQVSFQLASSKPYHRRGFYDANVTFNYRVLPPYRA